jgi:amino acid permease
MLLNADASELNQSRKTGKSRASQKKNAALSIFKDETDVLSQKSLLKPIVFG